MQNCIAVFPVSSPLHMCIPESVVQKIHSHIPFQLIWMLWWDPFVIDLLIRNSTPWSTYGYDQIHLWMFCWWAIQLLEVHLDMNFIAWSMWSKNTMNSSKQFDICNEDSSSWDLLSLNLKSIWDFLSQLGDITILMQFSVSWSCFFSFVCVRFTLLFHACEFVAVTRRTSTGGICEWTRQTIPCFLSPLTICMCNLWREEVGEGKSLPELLWIRTLLQLSVTKTEESLGTKSSVGSDPPRVCYAPSHMHAQSGECYSTFVQVLQAGLPLVASSWWLTLRKLALETRLSSWLQLFCMLYWHNEFFWFQAILTYHRLCVHPSWVLNQTVPLPGAVWEDTVFSNWANWVAPVWKTNAFLRKVKQAQSCES
jgi:hypothetical protein